MRKKLDKNKIIRVSATFRNIIYDKNRNPSYALFLNVNNVQNNKIITDHINVHISNEFLNFNPVRGDVFEFTANVTKYVKYRNSKYEEKKSDYGLNKPRNYKKIDFNYGNTFNKFEKFLHCKKIELNNAK